ncbi:MAG: PAS domain S-box protein, partial [Gemmatimonadales bacterium]|nr:PAS domain S-box protein [Gemmatimonadales bacterium]
SLAHHAADPFRLLVESVADYAIYMVDPAGLVASWNPAAERIYGYRAEEIIGRPFGVFYPPEDVVAGMAEDARQRALAAGHYEFECTRVRKDASRFWAVVSISDLKDYFGNHAGFSVVTRDITERKEAEEAVRRERDLSAATLASLPGVYYMYDEAGHFLRWNRLFEVVTGYSAEEIATLHPLELFGGADKKRVAERIEAVFRTGQGEVEADFVAKSGMRTPYYFTGVRAEIDGQRCLLGMGIDITAQRLAHEELQRTGDLLRAVAEGVSDAIFVKDRAGRYLLMNQAAANFVGKSIEEVLGQDDTALFDAADAGHVMERDRQVMESQLVETVEEELTAAGVKRAYLTTKAPYRDSDGKVIGVLGISREVTDRKLVEVALRIRNDLYAMLSRTNRAVSRCTSSEELYRELCAIAVETGRFQFAWVGEAVGERVNCVASAGNDNGYMDHLVISLDQEDPRSRGPTGRAVLTGESFVVNDFLASPMTALWHEHAKRSGFAASASFPLKEEGRVVAVLTLYAAVPGFFTDEMVATLSEITPSVSFALDGFVHERQRARAEERLEQSRALVRVASRVGRMGAWAVELEGLRVIWSEELLAILELSPEHSPDFEFGINIYLPQYRPIVREVFSKCVEEGTPFEREVQCLTATGRSLWVRVIGEPVRNGEGAIIGARGAFQDISDRRQLELQFRQAQKMEAVGRLAAGVAHDFNNLLTVINGYSDPSFVELAPDDPSRELLSEIHSAGQRAEGLTRQLLAFSRQQVLEPRVLNLNAIVSDTEKILRRLIGEDVVFVTNLDRTVGGVKADPGQVEQVLMNLVVNARDAMPMGGRLTIETQVVHLDESYCRRVPDLDPGDYVLLAVSDTGCGMDDATQAKIFEPFFTTKGQGKGTGLGLATVHGIVKQSRGHVAVYSEVGQGSTFKVYLPQVSDPFSAARPNAPLAGMPSGTETVLLVEDEGAVRTLACHILRRCGYRVMEAADGQDAVRLAESEAGPIHLLVSDVVMPFLGGRALAERIAATRPDCRVLFLSGYTDDAVIRHGVLEAECAFLQKPFSASSLALKVRSVLDGPS